MKILIETQITVEAPPTRIWQILTDFPAMHSWNPFIRSISGAPTPGNRLSVQIAPPDRAAMTFNPTILVADRERELRWIGTIIARGVFAGEHYFVLQPLGHSATRLRHGEIFSGLLAPILMRGTMLQATKQGFAEMNDALKKRAE